jgi:hypothetical protein
MKKAKSEMEDDLRAEYDLKSLRVRKLGSERNSFAGMTVRLEPDVAAMFPSAAAVNEALRLVVRVMQANPPLLPEIPPKPSVEAD